MPRRELTFRVFVSSTFSDLRAERDALQKTAFPKLRDYCAARGARFQAVDLRWGVSDEASLDQQTMRICLQELERCQRDSPRPNFVVLLGERYGWRPLPAAIPAGEFEALLPLMDPAARRLVAWEPGKEGWYRRDDNADPPEYVLRARPVAVEAGWSEERSRAARQEEADDWMTRIEPALNAGLRAAARTLWPAPDDPHRQKYEDSATHQEIRHGAFLAPDPRRHVFAYFRTIAGLPDDSRAAGYRDLIDGAIDGEARTRLGALERDLRELLGENVYDCQAQWLGAPGPSSPDVISDGHLPDLCRRVYDDLRGIIDRELDALERRSEVEREAEAHDEFGRGRAEHFVGREDELARIGDYLAGGSTSPMVVHGVGGSGKTALLAEAAGRLAATRRGGVISRFIGATPGSSDLRSLLDGLCRQLEPDRPAPAELGELVPEFATRLGRAGEGPPVVLLDALDQLAPAEGARQLRWLPWELPRGVKLVLSVLEADGADGDCGRAARGMGRASEQVRLGALDSEEAAQMLTARLVRAGRTLRPEQFSAVVGTGSGAALLPLRLELAFEEARRWRSFDPPRPLSPDAAGLVADLLGRLEQEQHHGRVMTRRALGYLAAARNGLTEEELLDVLSASADVLADFRRRSPRSPAADRLPVVIWARLRADLEAYLTQRRADGTTVVAFYHREIRDAIVGRYLGDEGPSRHTDLSNYFGCQATWPVDAARIVPGLPHVGIVPNVRKLAELPYQLAKGERWADLERTLCDFAFLEAKLRAGMAFQLREDFDLASGAWESAPIALVHDAISSAFAPLRARPHLTTQTLYNRLVWSDGGPTLAEALEAASRRLAACPWWIRAGAPPVVRAGVAETWAFGIASSIQSLAPSRRSVAAAGADGSAEIRDVSSGARLIRCDPNRGQVRAVLLDDDWGLIFVRADGSIRPEYGSADFAGRPGETRLALIPGQGVLAVGADHTLVAWNPEGGTVTVLATDLPAPLVALRVSRHGGAILYVAGQGAQRLGIVPPAGGGPARVLPWAGRRILDADIDPAGRHVVVSTLDRRLQILDIETGAVTAEVAYEQETKGAIKGPVRMCRLGADADSRRVVFATPGGQVAVWDWAGRRVERLDDYASKDAPEDVVLLEWVSPPGRVLLSTPRAMTSFAARPGLHDVRHAHDTAVTACAIAPGGRVVSIGMQDHSVRWFDCRGLRPLGRAYCRWPTAISTTDDPDVVYVGTQEGYVWKFRLGSPDRAAEPICAGLGPVVSVLVEAGGWLVVADQSGSTFRGRVGQEVSTALQFSAPGYRHRKTLAAAGGLPVSWGEDHLIGGVRTVITRLGEGRETGAIPPTWAASREARERSALHSSPAILADFAVSPDGSRLCLAGQETEVRPTAPSGGERSFGRPVAASKAEFLTDDLLAVLLEEEDWIEVWRVATDLPTLAALDVAGPISSLAARGNWIVAGSKSGRLISAYLEGQGRTGNP